MTDFLARRHKASSMLAGAAMLVPAAATAGLFTLWWSSSSKDPKPGENRFPGSSIVRSVGLALSSRRLRNLVLATAAITLVARRTGYAGYTWMLSRRWPPTIFALLWVLWYGAKVREMPLINCRWTQYNLQIVEKAGLGRRPYYPTFWMTNRHASTVLGSVLVELEQILYRKILGHQAVRWTRQTLSAFDGKPIYLDWATQGQQSRHHNPLNRPYSSIRTTSLGAGGSRGGDPASRPAGSTGRRGDASPIIVVLHGVSGTSTDGYLQRFAALCLDRRWRCVSFDYWRLDFGEWRDLDWLITALHEQFPAAPIIPVAFSAGGHLLIRYLAAVGRDTPIVAAATISACGDLVDEYTRVCRDENALYKKYLESAIIAGARKHASVDPSVAGDVERVVTQYGPRCDDVYDRFIATLPTATQGAEGGRAPEWLRPYSPPGRMLPSGHVDESVPLPHSLPLPLPPSGRGQNNDPYVKFHSTAAHYECTAGCKLDQIRVTTLMIHARDDPIVAFRESAWRAAGDNKHIISVATERGGHCGWAEGVSPLGPAYSDRVVVDYISAVLQLNAQVNYMAGVMQKMLNATNADGGGMSAGTGSGVWADDGSGQQPQPGYTARVCSEANIMAMMPPTMRRTSSDTGPIWI